jgi:hypothetical protein
MTEDFITKKWSNMWYKQWPMFRYETDPLFSHSLEVIPYYFETPEVIGTVMVRLDEETTSIGISEIRILFKDLNLEYFSNVTHGYETGIRLCVYVCMRTSRFRRLE